MMIIIIQLLLLLFECYVFMPLFFDYGFGEAVRLVVLSPFAIGALVLNLIITIFRLVKALIFRRTITILFNLSMLLINIIFVFIFLL